MNTDPTNIVEIQNISKVFGSVRAVDELTLSVPQGKVYGFIGPNGSGKTTTLRMIMQIIYPDSGSIKVFGQEQTSAANERIGYLPEERGLYKKMKVRDVLHFYGEIKNGAGIKEQVNHWLEKFDLLEWADKKVETLSKGMSQKVQFIASVLGKPDLLILDEPFSGLDPVNADLIKNEILGLRAKGTTVIFSTHDMSVAERMCDFIFMIFRGKKVLDGPLTAIQEQYGRDTVRLVCGDGTSVLNDLPGVEQINDFGRVQELRLAQKTDPQKLLAEIMSRTKIISFESAAPSLQDIFIRIAGPAAEEATNA